MENITKEFIKDTLVKNGRFNYKRALKYNLSTQQAYNIVYKTKTPICKCGKPTKFLNFKNGYTHSCGSKNCRSFKVKVIDNKTPEEIVENIDEFMKKSGELNGLKIKKHGCTTEEVYCVLHSITEPPRCKCGKKIPFKYAMYGLSCGETKCRYADIQSNNNKNLQVIEKRNARKKNAAERRKTRENDLRAEKNKIREEKNKEQMEQFGFLHDGRLDNYNDMNREYWVDNFIKNGHFLLHECMDHHKCSETTVRNKKKLFRILNTSINNKKYNFENRINDIFNGCFTVNTRQIITPLELDLYSEKHDFAIEFNGLVWHSFGESNHSMFNNKSLEQSKKNNHLAKTELCEEKGIQLFHIFDNEWLDARKKYIWISMIRGKLDLNIKIKAQECQIKEVQTEDVRKFLDENCIHGYVDSNIRMGLHHNNVLVQIMTFEETEEKTYELTRFCTKKNLSISTNELINHFEKTYKPSSILFNANRRWDTGDVCKDLGFEFVKNTDPGYWWFNKNSKELVGDRRFREQENYSKELSTESMFQSGNRRVWDSGDKVYIKECNETRR